jgi:GMP synthase-like glutamine amidotransferase
MSLPKETPYLLGREEITLRPSFFELQATERLFASGNYERKDKITFHVSHAMEVSRLPEGATLLASSKTTDIELYSIGNRALCTQSHPEFNTHYCEN